MRDYLLSIVGAVLIAVFTDILLPDKWNKYIKVITGLIIISTITSPLSKFHFPDMSDYFYEAQELTKAGEDRQNELVQKELARKICDDIKYRLKEEFNINADIRVTISVNAENEITGVEKIEISGGKIDEKVKARLEEVYSPGEVIADEYKKNH